ncbi:hypothetical protein L0Y49_02620 [bacterium]|nr:hypothetical protein [bacterium]MCI0680198.1 hypothetical protein [bacterium]
MKKLIGFFRGLFGKEPEATQPRRQPLVLATSNPNLEFKVRGLSKGVIVKRKFNTLMNFRGKFVGAHMCVDISLRGLPALSPGLRKPLWLDALQGAGVASLHIVGGSKEERRKYRMFSRGGENTLRVMSIVVDED